VAGRKTAYRRPRKRSTHGATGTPSGAATVLPHVNGVALVTKDAPQGGMETLRQSPPGLEAGQHDAGAPDEGVLHERAGDLQSTHLCPVDGRVVPNEAYDLPGHERVLARRGCHRGRRIPSRGHPPVVGGVPLPLDWGHDGARDAQLQQLPRGAVAGGTGVSSHGARTPGGRLGAGADLFPAVPAGLRVPVAAAMGVAQPLGDHPGASGGVAPAVTPGLRAPVATAMGDMLGPAAAPVPTVGYPPPSRRGS